MTWVNCLSNESVVFNTGRVLWNMDTLISQIMVPVGICSGDSAGYAFEEV